MTTVKPPSSVSSVVALNDERRAALSASNDTPYRTMPEALAGTVAQYPGKKALNYFGRDYTNNNELAAGKRGKVCLKGNGIISGYWRNSEATKRNLPQWLAAYRRHRLCQ